MAETRWVKQRELDRDSSYFAVATDGLRIPIWNISGFILLSRYTRANIEQMQAENALIAYALDTQLGLMTNSRTISIWENMPAIRKFTYEEAHHESMIALRKLKSLRVKHAIWKFPASHGLPDWNEAHLRIYGPRQC